MRFQTLSEWLDWQQQLHPKSIELGLERVGRVFDRMSLGKVADQVITIAGTNGKGSTVAYYETWLKNAGFRVGSYTSPHILHYNERIRIDTQTVTDDQLCLAFSAIDEARDQTPLTYFEFGTLAAMYLMHQQQVDIAIFEVGLGGRLDAVNIIDPDLAHITMIGLDHQDWLGDTRELIGIEKAGILRENGRAIYNDPRPVSAVIEQMNSLNTHSSILGIDYEYSLIDEHFMEWKSVELSLRLQPPLQGDHQALNISGVLAGLNSLGYLDGLNLQVIIDRFKGVSLAGRLQHAESLLPATVWLDVGHNEDAAQVISEFLKQTKRGMSEQGKVYLLLGMLADKNPRAFVRKFSSEVDEWWLMGLECERGMSAREIGNQVDGLIETGQVFENALLAMEHAMSSLNNQDILLVTGSFFSVEATLKTPYLNSVS